MSSVKFEAKINEMTSAEAELSIEIKKNWTDMMSNASIRSLLRLRLEVLKFIVVVGDVKKHAKKLREFSSRIAELEAVPLNSKCIIDILKPAKKIRAEFDEWKKGSVTNMVSEDHIKLIELEAEVEVSKAA
jgi:hypothetical protein